jgi:PPE-repeat protein
VKSSSLTTRPTRQVPPGLPDPSWGAIPEITTARVQTGPGALPMVQAATAWTAKAVQYGEQAARWSALMAQSSVAWQSMTVTPVAMASLSKMVAWYSVQIANATKAAMQAAAQAAAHTTAATSVVQLPTIAANHVTRAVLYATNFFGVNTVPIAVKEAEYWLQMPAQNTAVMGAYEAATMANLAGLQTVVPMVPMTVPGLSAVSLGLSSAQAAAGAPIAAFDDGTFAAVGGSSAGQTGLMMGAGVAGDAGQTEQRIQTAASLATNAGQQAGDGQAIPDSATQSMTSTLSQALGQATQAPSQLGSSVSQLGQAPQQFMQSVLGPLQSMMNGNGGAYGLDATGTPVSQIGMLGASPLSNHPLAGGSGPTMGAGMLSGAGLPGAAGVSARTPFMSSLTAAPASSTSTTADEEVVTGQSATPRAGAAPVGFMPAAAGRRQDQQSGSIKALVAPQPLVFGDAADATDDW